MNKKITAVLTGIPFLAALGLVITYLLFAYLAVNPLAQRVLPWVGEKLLDSRIEVGAVRFDPLSLELNVEKFRLSRADGGSLAGFDHLYVDLQADSLFRFAWHLRAIRVSGPEVSVETGKDGRLNWADLMALLNKDSKPSSTMPRVVIDQLKIDKGRVQYAELNRAQPFRTALAPLALELGQFSTLPEDRGDYLVAADLAGLGGKLRWKGNLGVNPVASAGSVELQGLKLASLLSLARQTDLPLTLNSGELGLRFGYDFAIVAGKKAPYPHLRLKEIAVTLAGLSGALNPRTSLALQSAGTTIPAIDLKLDGGVQLQLHPFDVAATDLRLQHDGRTLLTLERVDVDRIAADLAQQRLAVGVVRLHQGTVRATRYRDGLLDWQQALPAKAEIQSASKPDVAVDADTKRVATAPADKTSATDTTTDMSTVPRSATASARTRPFRYEIAEIRLEDWKLEAEDRSFVRPLRAAVDRINVSLRLADEGEGLRVGQLAAVLESLSLQAPGSPYQPTAQRASQQSSPVARLARVALSGGELDLNARRVNAAELSLSGLQTQVVMNADKSLNWQALLQPATAAAASAAPTSTSASKSATAKPVSPPSGAPRARPTSSPAAGTADWRVALAHLRLDKATVHFEDRSLLQPVAVDLQDASVDARDLSLDPRKPIALNARLPIRQGGQLDVRGKLSAVPLRGEMQLKLGGLQLKPYSPYVSQFAMVNLTGGQAAIQGRLKFGMAREFSARFDGGFDIGGLAVAKESDGSAFLSWDALSSDSLSVSLAPNRLHMGELRIVHPTARLIINEDKTINLQQLLRTPPNVATSAATSAATPSTPVVSTAVKADKASPAGATGFPFTIERIRVSDGDLEFADLSLRPQFGTHIHYLGGVINGLSSDAAGVAQVELDGKVDDYGSARVRGSIQPMRATEFTDLKVAFRNLEMNRLTPYSGKFAGRKIDSGKLTVDLEYKLKQRQLVGENKVVINKLKLGERVDSRDAMSLPLDLAIALLEDSDGVIDIDLPITGSLDDPQFSYGKIVWKAIFNVLEKVVTAPFRAIGKLLGISADKLEAISFDPGSAVLLPPEQEKLKSVAGALAKRPALTLQLAPAFDPAADKAALQELATRRDVAAELGMKLAPGEPVGPLDLSSVKVQTAIENLLKDRSGEKRGLKLVDSVKDYFRKTRPEDLPKIAAQLERLRSTVKIGDAELSALAQSRAQAVRDYLLASGGLTASRLNVGAAAKVSGDGQSVALKMSLGTAGGL